VTVYDQVESNPKDYNVMDAHQQYVEEKCDSFLSVGVAAVRGDDARPLAGVVGGAAVNEFEGWDRTRRRRRERSDH
jgi:methanol:N,N-dimethyl-4-nitrosoaniline oxidoreductase